MKTKIAKFVVFNTDGRPVCSRLDAFPTIRAAIFTACMACSYQRDDSSLDRTTLADTVALADIDGRCCIYKVTNDDLRALRYRKLG